MQVGVVSAGAPQARGRSLAKLGGAAIAGAALALTTMGSPAFADNAATGTAQTGQGVSVRVELNGNKKVSSAGEIKLAINGNEPVISYCIDYHHPLSRQKTYQEESWKDSKIKNLGKVQWIINNSFPKVTVANVAKAANVDLAGIPADRAEHLVYAATQVAIWHNSDGVALAKRSNNWQPENQDYQPVNGKGEPVGPVVPRKAQYDLLEKIYKHLTDAADKSSGLEEPPPALKIEPEQKNGPVGGKTGPFTVRSSGAEVTLTATGGKIVDAEGKPVTKLADGGSFWVTSDAGAQVAVKAAASGTVPTGRVFVAQEGPNEHQKIILAGTATTQLVAAATATFGAAPTQTSSSSSAAGGATLPVTGASVTVAVSTGLVLLLAGGALALMAARRRRRVTFTA